MKISVVIPVFNAKAYVEKCIKSVIQQSYNDIEIIVINDGSTDNSAELCSKLANIDNRIKLINQTNKGAAAARNAGIDEATGRYILFLDADDIWVDKDGVKKLVSILKNNSKIDFCLFLLANINKLGNLSRIAFSKYNFSASENIHDILSHLIRLNQFVPSAWIQIVRLSFLKDNNLYFEDGLLCEDLNWALQLWQKAQKVTYTNLLFYGYRLYGESFSNRHLIKQTRDNINIIKKWFEKDLNKDFKAAILPFLSDLLSSLYKNYYFTDRIHKKEIAENLKSLAFLLQYSSNKKSLRVYYTYKIFGFKLCVAFWGIYTIIKRKITSS